MERLSKTVNKTTYEYETECNLLLPTVALLEHQLSQCRYWYYVKAEPLMEDHEYDRVEKRLEKIYEDYPSLRTNHSNTLRVGSSLSNSYSDCVMVERLNTIPTVRIGEVSY